jgi:hypothetical protein
MRKNRWLNLSPQGVINRANLVQKLSQALVAIGEVLPRADLSAELYQTEYMEAALARLYTYIILFLTLCVKWYNRSSLGRFWSGLKSPFELDYQELVEQIRRCSEAVEDLTNAGARAEIRHVRVLAELHHSQSRELDAKLLKMLEVQERIEASVVQVLEVATSNKTIAERMSGGVRGISGGILRMELHLIIQFFEPEVLPEAALLRVQSLARREQSISLQNPKNRKVRNMIQNWVVKDGSSLLIVRVGLCARNQARELAAGVIEALKSSTQCVFWNISGLRASKGAGNMAELFKSLIFQVLQHSGGQFCNLAEQLNLSKVRDVHTDHEWVDLTCLLFSRLPKAFVIIEATSLCKTYQHEPGWVNQFCGYLRTIVDRCSTQGNELKMLLVMYGNSYQVETKAANVLVTALQPTIPVPPRLQHMTRRSGQDAKGWKFPKSKVRTRS